MPPPIVSIGLPVYNGERYLAGAIDMLARQTWADYELIIVDNGSRDATARLCEAAAARDPRIRYVRHDQTVPLVDNFWRTFLLARGRYFLWNAADDRRPADAIARAVAALEADPALAMVHGPVELGIGGHGETLVVANDVMATGSSPVERVANYTRHLRHNAALYGVYRRDRLARVAFRQHVGQDFLVGLQVAMIGPIGYLPAPLICYLHANGPIDDPMYRRQPLSVRTLLAWPRNRFKGSIVLARGWHYLLREGGTPAGVRLRAALAFTAAFVVRYWRHLAQEVIFAFATPIACLLWPITEGARRIRRRALSSSSIQP